MSRAGDGGSKAEQAFRAAFERLKHGQTVHLPLGAAVTQNNVAREAGCDPTALRKGRYPELVTEIQRWRESSARAGQLAPSAELRAARERNRVLREQVRAALVQRDTMASELLAARARLRELYQEITRLRAQLGIEASNVSILRVGRNPII